MTGIAEQTSVVLASGRLFFAALYLMSEKALRQTASRLQYSLVGMVIITGVRFGMTQLQRPLAVIQLNVPPAAVRERVGEQARWFIDALGLTPHSYILCRPHTGETLPAFSRICGALLSGSWAMVTDHADWSERTVAWLRDAMALRLPLLGVCYGHQLMAYALGGEVADNPAGWERGALPVELLPAAAQDELLLNLPASFPVWLSHRQSVLTPPDGAQVLARSAADGCQILRYHEKALSVQFHPEFNASIMAACLAAVGAPPLTSWPEADSARQILLNFWRSLVQSEQARL